jgi:hypothetical protein
MRPRYAAVISLILALAVGAGAYAAQQTSAASSSSATAGAKGVSAQVARRTRALDRMEASLRRALRQRPPALPRMPKFKPVKVEPVTTPPAAGSATANASTPPAAPAQPATQPRVVYVRPPARVVTVHRKGGEHEDEGAEHEDDGHDAHEGGGFDD